MITVKLKGRNAKVLHIALVEIEACFGRLYTIGGEETTPPSVVVEIDDTETYHYGYIEVSPGA